MCFVLRHTKKRNTSAFLVKEISSIFLSSFLPALSRGDDTLEYVNKDSSVDSYRGPMHRSAFKKTKKLFVGGTERPVAKCFSDSSATRNMKWFCGAWRVCSFGYNCLMR